MPHEVKEEEIILYKKPREAMKIDDETDERPEAVIERIKAQKEEAEAREFTEAIATETIGVTREEAEQALEEADK